MNHIVQFRVMNLYKTGSESRQFNDIIHLGNINKESAANNGTCKFYFKMFYFIFQICFCAHRRTLDVLIKEAVKIQNMDVMTAIAETIKTS